MQRTYLYVSPEEKSAVESRGAKWDNASKRWYIDADQSPGDFAKWLLLSNQEPEFNIISDRAFVVAATVCCQECSTPTEVICIYCDAGFASDEPLTNFSVSCVTAITEELQQQLRSWPNFQKAEGGLYVNRCSSCNARIDDLYLHTEPGDAFFDIPQLLIESTKLTPLVGTIRLSGNEHFQVE